MIDSVCRRSLFPAGLRPLDRPYIIHIKLDSGASQAAHMTHLHLQIQFASDFERYATWSCITPPTRITPPLPYFGSQRYMKHYADFLSSLFFFGQRVIAITWQVWKK